MEHIPMPSSPSYVDVVKITPPLNDKPIVPPAVDSTNSGMKFWHSGSRRNPKASAYYTITLGNEYGTISMVNSCPINGYIYDINGKYIS